MFLMKNIVQNFIKNKPKVKVTLLSNRNDLNKRVSFHNSAIVQLKTFTENENNFAYSVMEKSGYVQDLNYENKNVSSTKYSFDVSNIEDCFRETPQSLFQILERLGKYCTENSLCISDNRFDNFIDTLTDNIKYATDNELKSIFFSLAKCSPTKSIRTRNFIEVWAALDDECMNRLHLMSFDDMLSYISLFYLLNVIRYSDFCQKSLLKLANKSKKLSKAHLVQTMFYIGVKRKPPHDMHYLEVYIENNFTQFDIDELAIISMGFFKSKTPIRSSELVVKIIDKVIETADEIHEVSLAALLKVIRYSMKILVDNKIYELLDCLQHQVPRLSIMCNVHIALLGTATLTLHSSCLTKISENVLNTITNTRLKDLERLVLTFGTFHFVPKTEECFFTKVVEELNKESREEEIKIHGSSFACCVAYLGLINVYPQNLMQKVLNKEFLTKTYGKHCFTYGREILTVHNLAKIFYSDVDMSPLSDKEVVVLAKKYTDFVPDENYKMQYNVTENMFLDVKRTLREVRGGEEFVTGDHILSHHQRGDIIICNDHKGLPKEVDKAFVKKRFGMIHYPPDDNYWIVFIIAGRNAMIQNGGGPTGHFITKRRELNKLGFYAAVVSWHIYSECRNKNEKIEYLNSLIDDALKYCNKKMNT